MSCNKPFKSAEANAKSYLRTKGIIDKYLNIIDYPAFIKENKAMTKHGIKEYGIDGQWFFAENEGKKAIPNKELFEQVDRLNKIPNPKIFELKLLELNKNKTQSFANKFIFGEKKESKKPQQDFVLLEETRNQNLNEIRDKLFNGNLTNQSANQFLRNALYNLDLNNETKNIVKSLLTTRANIKFINKSQLASTDTYAQYNSDKREIQVNREILGTGNLYYAFESLLHEVIHDFTVHALMNPKNDLQRNFRDNIQEVFKQYKDLSKSNLYGFENEYEFVAEIMSNSSFRDHLRDLKINSNQSILNKIISFFRRLFGGKSESSKNVDKIIESILEISTKEYENYNSLTDYNYVFEKKTEKSKKNKYSDEFNKELLDTKSLIKNILARIDAVKNKSRAKKGYKTETQKKFNALQDLMEDLYNKSTNEALYEFANFANKEIEILLDILDKKIDEGKITSDFLTRSESYISIYSSLNDIRAISNRQYDNRELTKEQYDNINQSLQKAKSNFETFNDRYVDLGRDLLAEKLAPYNNKPIDRRKEQLEREFNSLGLNKSNTNKSEWIEDKLNEEIDSLKQEALEEVRRQLETIPMDIGGNTLNLVSEKNINNLIIQLTSLSIDHSEMELRDFIVGLRYDFYNKTKEYGAKGVRNDNKYDKLLSTDSQGNYYLLSEYSPKFIEEYKTEQNKLFDINDKYGFKSKESRVQFKKFIAWKKKNMITKYNNLGIVISQKPIDKWKDKKYDKLNDKDKKYLNFLKDKAREADEMTLGYKSLIFKYLDAEFIKLPSIRRTDLDKLLSGKIKDVASEKIGDLTKIREDDTTRGELLDKNVDKNNNIVKKLVTINNEERHLVPIHYRNNINPKDQSLDLPTIFLLNSSMAKEYNIKQNLEADSKLLLDVVYNSKVNKVESFTNKLWKSAFSNSENELVDIQIDGKDSNVYTKLKSMFENRIYKITEASSGKIGGKDIASIASGVASYSANLALAVNYLSAIPNLMQGKIQNFIESVGKNVFTRADLRWAEKTYFEELANGGLNDLGSITNNSKLQLLLDKFDLMGDFNAIKNKFEDSNKFRTLFKASTLHGMNGVAEHYIQSTLMLAVMKSIKLKNKNNEFIDINGKKVSEKNAMNLYEAFTVKDGILEFNKNANHSSFTRNSFSELGMLEHQSLIRKKIIDLHGQYDNKWQSHIQRYWWGKLAFMFRKWLIPAYHRRWRGTVHVNKKYEDLEEHQKFYDSSLREYNDGMYTSFIRFIWQGVIPALKEFKIEIAKTNWNELTDREKGNIHKTIREVLVMSIMMTAANIAYVAAKAAPDEGDEKLLYTLAYLFKRQETELMQYYSINDQMRIFRTPFAALSTAEKATNWLAQIMPFNIGDKYEQGPNKDQFKAWVKTKKLIPVISQTERSAQESFNYLKSISD